MVADDTRSISGILTDRRTGVFEFSLAGNLVHSVISNRFDLDSQANNFRRTVDLVSTIHSLTDFSTK